MWSDGRLAFLTEMSLRRTDRFPIGTLDYKSAQLSATRGAMRQRESEAQEYAR